MSMLKGIGTVVALLGLLVLGIWALVHFAGLQGSLLWTGVLGAIAWAIRNSIEKRREHIRLLAEAKRTHYLEFLDFFNNIIEETKASEAKTRGTKMGVAQDLPIAEVRKWSLRLTLVGSDEVVRAWNRTRSVAAELKGSGPGIPVLAAWGQLWLAMRKDCGHPETKLAVPEVLASFVNEIDRYKKWLVEKS